MTRNLGPVSHSLLGAYVGRPFPLVATVAAYFDDSHNDGILTVAGYVGDVEDWDNAFVPSWSAFLSEAPWPQPIPEYKSSDCRHRAGSFSGWTQDQCTEATTRAVDVITTAISPSAMFGVAMLIEMPPGWDQSLRDQFVSFAYIVSFGIIVMTSIRLIHEVLKDQPGGRVQFMFDSQPGLEGRSYEMFEAARKIFVPEQEVIKIAKPNFVDSKDVLPIQAADLFAHETYKEYKNRREGRAPSRALTRLLDGRYHYAAYVDAATTESLVARRLAGEALTVDLLKAEVCLFRTGRALRANG